MRGRQHRLRGLSLVELLVGTALGLVLVAVALVAWGHQLRETRHLLLETRLMQDLRATVELMTRDLRRAGRWAEATGGVWRDSRTPVRVNPHARPVLSGDEIGFSYSAPDSPDRDTADLSGPLGYRLRQGVVEMKLAGGQWQAMTDAGTVRVTQFKIADNTHVQMIEGLCALPCPSPSASSGPDACPPRQAVQRVDLHLRAHAAGDPSVVRELQSTVRLRSDVLLGKCPS